MALSRHIEYSDLENDPQDPLLKFCDGTFGDFRFDRKWSETGLIPEYSSI